MLSPRLGLVETQRYLIGWWQWWLEGLLLRAVTRVAPAGRRSGSLLRCLGALAHLILLRILATLRVALCGADLLLRHKILQ